MKSYCYTKVSLIAAAGLLSENLLVWSFEMQIRFLLYCEKKQLTREPDCE